MNRVLQFLDTVVTGFLNWLYSLPPDSFKEYEAALVAYLVALHFISPANSAEWVAVGFAIYGIIKAIRDVSSASVTKAQLSTPTLVATKNNSQ